MKQVGGGVVLPGLLPAGVHPGGYPVAGSQLAANHADPVEDDAATHPLGVTDEGTAPRPLQLAAVTHLTAPLRIEGGCVEGDVTALPLAQRAHGLFPGDEANNLRLALGGVVTGEAGFAAFPCALVGRDRKSVV